MNENEAGTAFGCGCLFGLLLAIAVQIAWVAGWVLVQAVLR